MHFLFARLRKRDRGFFHVPDVAAGARTLLERTVSRRMKVCLENVLLRSDRCLSQDHLTGTGKFLQSADWALNGKHSRQREQVALRRSGSPGWFQTGASCQSGCCCVTRLRSRTRNPGKTAVQGREGGLTSLAVPRWCGCCRNI